MLGDAKARLTLMSKISVKVSQAQMEKIRFQTINLHILREILKNHVLNRNRL